MKIPVVGQIVTISKNYGFGSKVIVCSLRHPVHLLEAALIGADVATIPYKVIEQLIQHPLTDIGIEKFLADWKRVPQKWKWFWSGKNMRPGENMKR